VTFKAGTTFQIYIGGDEKGQGKREKDSERKITRSHGIREKGNGTDEYHVWGKTTRKKSRERQRHSTNDKQSGVEGEKGLTRKNAETLKRVLRGRQMNQLQKKRKTGAGAEFKLRKRRWKEDPIGEKTEGGLWWGMGKTVSCNWAGRIRIKKAAKGALRSKRGKNPPEKRKGGEKHDSANRKAG